MKDFFNSPDALIRNPDPWGFGAGKGGGMSFSQAGEPGEVHHSHDPSVQKNRQGSTPDSPWLYPSRRVRLRGLTSATEMNGKLGVLIEAGPGGKWHVRLDDGLGDKLVKVENLETITGAPRAQDQNKRNAHLAQGPEICGIGPPADYCLAGTWTDWMPQDLLWDWQKECYMLTAEVLDDGPSLFSIGKGKAGSLKWKPQREQHTLGHTSGVYEIKLLFRESGTLKRVETQRLSDVEQPPPLLLTSAEANVEETEAAEAAVAMERQECTRAQVCSTLDGLLREACPEFSESELIELERKLAKVEVCTLPEMLSSLSDRRKALNDRLKAIGEKALSGKLIRSLRERVDALGLAT